MAVQRVGEMTLEELRQIIREEIETLELLRSDSNIEHQAAREAVDWFKHNRLPLRPSRLP